MLIGELSDAEIVSEYPSVLLRIRCEVGKVNGAGKAPAARRTKNSTETSMNALCKKPPFFTNPYLLYCIARTIYTFDY